MKIKELFAADVTRDIAPVVYFHEKDPEKVSDEVSEYIITGGYPESDPRHKRIEFGIHEQFVKLLNNIAADLKKSHGADLPASWISGFYGSGKSSFAKLLGLALDGMVLPNGQSLAEVLLKRDDSPKADEFQAAWQAVVSQIQPMAVVFDIGAVARDNEHIHSAVKREVQKRLGYCPMSHHVADYELKLELDGMWNAFLANAEKTLGKTWDEVNSHQLAEDDFSEVLHVMFPDRYTDPMSWIDSRAGSKSAVGSSVEETTRTLTEMLKLRAPGKTLFLIVDEVSQYIHQNEQRMLKLQSFISDLGQKLKGQVWLLTTGQQKLEDTEDVTVLGKLKDRYPPKFRVHLAATNIRDVVHKRLLKKSPDKESILRTEFQKYRSDLKLYAYSCENITEEDFLEVYPLLPGYMDLLMQITSNMRLRSTRFKGDEHAIRGLLQLLGELFKEQALGEKELGALITINSIYEVQQSALDADIQNTMMRILGHDDIVSDELAAKVAKAVSLLELIQEQVPTTLKLISQCLYNRIGKGNNEPEVRTALEKLCSLGLLSYSEKLGYKIQSSAGQEWQRERDTYGVTRDEISTIIVEKLKELVGNLERPRYKKKPFPWTALFTDGRTKRDERIQSSNDQAVVTLDFRYVTTIEERNAEKWIQDSGSNDLENRIIWVVGKLGQLEATIRDLARSRHSINKYASYIQSLPQSRQRLFYEEQSRCEDLERQARDYVSQAFMDGNIYFRQRSIDIGSHGAAFSKVSKSIAESLLPELYSHYIDIAVTPGELNQLLEPQLSGPSQKFMSNGLGVLDLDASKYIPTCTGEVPGRIFHFIQDSAGVSGSVLITHFGGPPCGYPQDVLKACLAGLLRAGKVRIRPESGDVITSIKDPGVKDLFQKERDLKRSDIFPPEDVDITGRDRIAICSFFNTPPLSVDLDRENDAIADAVFHHFPIQVTRLQELERKYNQLPNRPDLPPALVKLRRALEDCKRSRHVEPTVLAVKKNLDALRDGMHELGILLTEVTDKNITIVAKAASVLQNQISQLHATNNLVGLEEDVESIREQLRIDRPWRDIAHIEPSLKVIQDRYKEIRLDLIKKQEEVAQEIREKLKQRKGFEKLSPDQSHTVLRPIALKMYTTTPDDLQPTLEQLRDSVFTRMKEAEEEANNRLDDLLSELTEKTIVKFRTNLSGREVASKEDVENLLNELRERLLALLKDDKRIRLL